MDLDSTQHFTRLKQWLEAEAEAEKAQFMSRLERDAGGKGEGSGTSLRELVVEEETTGLGGRAIVILRPRSRGPLPWTSLDSGSPIFLRREGDKSWAERGVVVERQARDIHVAFEENLPEVDGPVSYRLDLAFDEISRRRERQALDRVARAKGDRLASLREVLLGRQAPRWDAEAGVQDFLDPSLNPAQHAAVDLALRARDLAIVHGPPGTGKTTTLVEIVRQSLRRGQSVLVSAPSNLGVDNLLEKLVAAGEKPLRLGHPARVMESLRPYTLDALIEKHEDTRLARGLMREASVLFRLAQRYTRAAPPKGARQANVQEARSMMADARQLEARAISRVLDGARVVCATATGVDASLLGARRFDLLVFDEAAQGTEATAWIPLARVDRVVLGGDHCQLPPTLMARDGAAAGLGISLMERLVGLYGDQVTRLLSCQYRMHERIMGFSAQEFYEGRLQAHPSVAGHTLAAGSDSPLQFIDTAGAGFHEVQGAEGSSLCNEREAAFLVAKAQMLMAAGVPAANIAAISPYSAQVRLLRDLLAASPIEVDTIDGFQGREKDVILLSLVRSNDEQEIGFLAETRRLNVALTRARRLLVVIGDSATLGAHSFFQRWLAYVESHQAYRSIWEEAPELIPNL